MPPRCCRSFFFQAEDGIRDLTVTGVQTCALPISNSPAAHLTAQPGQRPPVKSIISLTEEQIDQIAYNPPRSEEHTSELQSQSNLVCRHLLEKKQRETTEC